MWKWYICDTNMPWIVAGILHLCWEHWFYKFCLLLAQIIAGYDECHECSFQEEYIREKTGQTYTHPSCYSLCHVFHWSHWQVRQFPALDFLIMLPSLHEITSTKKEEEERICISTIVIFSCHYLHMISYMEFCSATFINRKYYYLSLGKEWKLSLILTTD